MGGKYKSVLVLTFLTMTLDIVVWGIMNSGKINQFKQIPILSSDNTEVTENGKDLNKDVIQDRLEIEDPEIFNQHPNPDLHEGIHLESSGGILIEQMQPNLNQTELFSERFIHFLIKNIGKEDEYVHVNVTDEKGYFQKIPPTEFYLPSGSTKEISVKMINPPQLPITTGQGAGQRLPDKITINASSKKHTAKRSAYYYPGSEYDYGQQQYSQPFCYDRYVTGSCRYRMDPYECDQYKWTAYATIQNPGGIQQLRSIPEGLYIPPEFHPGTRDRLRVYLTLTCCVPIAQFLSVHPYSPNVGNACIVDVRELQGLNPAEIAGIVIGVVVLLIIICVVIGILIRRRRMNTILVGHSPTPTTTRRTREREVVSRE